MLRNSRRGLRKSLRRNSDSGNIMEGMANLVDVMLVFACGLMIAIVLHWNVDLENVLDIITDEDLQEVDNVDSIIEGAEQSDFYESKGNVYEDKETGKLYIIQE